MGYIIIFVCKLLKVIFFQRKPLLTKIDSNHVNKPFSDSNKEKTRRYIDRNSTEEKERERKRPKRIRKILPTARNKGY